jgi:heme exporter protein C
MHNTTQPQNAPTSGWTRHANPARFRARAERVRRFVGMLCLPLLITGLYLALFASPADYQQAHAVRIMYVHVPAAWCAMMVYAAMSLCALSYIIWRHIAAAYCLIAAAPVGACFTALCLITGAIWGQPMWGTWWVWDARLTSVLILFFIYMGILAVARAFDSQRHGMEAASWLTIIGAVNLPVIKYSVEWWNTLHQGPSISSASRLLDPALAPGMLAPLLVMAGAFTLLAVWLVLLRLESALLAAKQQSQRNKA